MKRELEFLLLLEELEDVPQSVLKVRLTPTTVCCLHMHVDNPDPVTTLWLYVDKAQIISFALNSDKVLHYQLLFCTCARLSKTCYTAFFLLSFFHFNKY